MDDQTAFDLLRRHFPNAREKALRDFAEYIDTRAPIAGVLTEAHEHNAQLDRVKRVRKLANALWREYLELPVGKKGPGSIQMKLRDAVYGLTGEPPPPFESLKGEDGKPLYPRKAGALDAVRDQIASSYPLHHNQREAGFRSKVALVEFARQVWVKLKDSQPPRIPSEGTPFYNFVSDLIVHYGKPWGVDKTFRAWAKYSPPPD